LLLCSYRQPRTPERDRQSKREQECLQRQMTSPSVRRQREYDRQPPMPQPYFGAPAVAGPPRVNWQERLEQGFQSRHAQQLRDRGGPLRDQNNRPPQQFITGQQERYAEEEIQHTAHLRAIQRQRQMDHDQAALQEALQHQARVAELQRQQQHQRDM